MQTLLRAALVLSLATAGGMSLAQELPAPDAPGIAAPDARWERVFTRTAPISGGLTEGPAAAPDGTIFFSDIPSGPDRGMIQRFDPKTGTTTVFTDDSHKSNGLCFDASGDLYACEGANGGGRALVRWNIATRERTVIVDRFEGKRFNAPNDLCIDRQGRVYFTDPRYLGDEPRELAHRAVYRVDWPSGRSAPARVSEVTHEVSKPNGIALSPDERTLYVIEHDNGTEQIDPTKPDPPHGPMALYAFPLNERGEVAGPRKTLYDFSPDKGCDGMTIDSQGNLYLAWRSLKTPGVLILDPTGKRLGLLATGAANQEARPPVGLPSNVEFGRGADAHTLYATVDLSLYRIRLLSQGANRAEKP